MTENTAPNQIQIIRKMIEMGATDEQILQNLKELGVDSKTAMQLLAAGRREEKGYIRTVLTKPEIVIDSYKSLVEGVEIEVDIIQRPGDFVLEYFLNFPEYGSGTKALLVNLKNSIISDSTIRTEKMLDPKFIFSLKQKFREKASHLLDQELPNVDSETKKILTVVILQEMLGLGKIEFLLADSNLEEIVINSAQEPVWVYNKKFGWLKTNIFIQPEEEIQNFASIIARRVGKQITVLSPLLDAHLITGDRANATLFPISSRGNTITIRRFRRDPWTAVDFIKNKTVNSEIMALIWLAMQYEMNIIISGGTASGKTSILNVMLPFIQPNQRIISIEDSVSGESEIVFEKDDQATKTTVGELIDGLIEDDSIRDAIVENDEGIRIPSMSKAGKIEWKEPSHFIRHWAKKDLLKITLKSGRTVEVTPDHSLFSLNEEGKIVPIAGNELSTKTRIAMVDEGELHLLTEKNISANDSTTQAIIQQKIFAKFDKIEKITRKAFEGFVYDFSVPENESFICNNIVCHNTRELLLPDFLHWVPMTTREATAEGKGEITMLELLVNSLRMRPDRIIVGEVRRQREAEVMFEGMHTGHSVYTTFHANTAEETIRRMTNPPLNIPPSMLDSVHLNLVMFRNRRLGVRRVLQIAEFIPEKRGSEEVLRPNVLYRWRPSTDEIVRNAESIRFEDELSLHTGMNPQAIREEIKTKQRILEWMVSNNLHNINQVGRAMAEYYMDEEKVLGWVQKGTIPGFLKKENLPSTGEE